MGTYRLSQKAEEDIIRIYQYGVMRFGETQADQYYDAFFERFESIAKSPHLYPSADDIRQGYRKSVCGTDTIYYQIEETGTVEITRILGSQDIENALDN